MVKKDITIGGNIAAAGQTKPSTVIITQPKRFGLDISDMVAAITAAENVDYPNRTKLLDMYTSIMQDSHIDSVTSKREDALTATKIEFKRDGEVIDDVNRHINTPWFRSLLVDILHARWWGFTCLQFYIEKGKIKYELIPRKNVQPVKQQILHRQTDLIGTPFDAYRNIAFIGGQRDLGKLFKAIPWVLYKRSDTANWAEFGELFGMPILEYIYDTGDDKARQKALEDSRNRGSLTTLIHARDTELNLKESSNKSGNVDVYDKLLQVCNQELSKLFLGNTLTTEVADKGTQALGTVHQDEELKKESSDLQFVLDTLNHTLTDIFLALGIDVSNGEFGVPKVKAKDQATRAKVLGDLVRDFALPISHDYLYTEFGIDKPDNYDDIMAAALAASVSPNNTTPIDEPIDEPINEPNNELALEQELPKSNKLASRVFNFFAKALTDDKADHSNW